MILYIRSIAFNFLFFFGSLSFSILLLWVLFLPRRKAINIINTYYFGFLNFIEKYILGLHLKIEGLENLPQNESYILAAKHQSAYETLKLPLILNDPAVVLKRELTWIPIWGWYPKKMGMIPIDRGSATQAMRSIITGAQKVKSEQRPIIIFPQGTRVKPGEKSEYRAGLAKLYKDIDLPIIPMALNSGVYWGKNSFWKKSGTVTFKFLPVIPAGLPPKEMMERLENVIETESNALIIKKCSRRN